MPIIIVGTRGRTVKDGTVDATTTICNHCGELVSMQSVRHKRYLTLFFVPLIPLEKGRAAMQCPNCKTLFYRREDS